jgi:hypothetical protein
MLEDLKLAHEPLIARSTSGLPAARLDPPSDGRHFCSMFSLTCRHVRSTHRSCLPSLTSEAQTNGACSTPYVSPCPYRYPSPVLPSLPHTTIFTITYRYSHHHAIPPAGSRLRSVPNREVRHISLQDHFLAAVFPRLD